MIFKDQRIALAAITIAAVSFLGAISPVFAAEIVPKAEAQSAAVQSAVDQLGDKASQLSDREKLQGVIEVLISQVSDLEKSLAVLKGINDQQAATRDEHIAYLDEAMVFLIAVKIDAETADVKFLADQIREWREDVLGPKVSEIVDFALIFQVKSILRTAESRYLKIFADVRRLEDLNILKGDKAGNLLWDARLLLTGAADLRNQAEGLLYKDNVPDGKIRQLLSDSIAKIRLAYNKFLEISQLVKESLK
ncbi:MAG: hypothetical protein Q8L24_02570 [bacterium]|nr:hypothetical protein [bacterium]